MTKRDTNKSVPNHEASRDGRNESTEIKSLRRSRAFTTFQARVNRALVLANDESHLLAEIAHLAVEHTGARLAWFGRPNEQQWFEVLAAAGPATDTYLEDIRASTDPSLPEGRGPWGRAWREERVLFNRSFVDMPTFAPWQARAAACGLESSVTLPVWRSGHMWAVCSIYLPETFWLDPDLRSILESLSEDLSRGLDALDARRLNFSLTRHTDVAIAVVTRRRLDYVNPRFADLFGVAQPEALIGRSTRSLYVDDATYQHIGIGYQEIDRQGVVRFQNVRCIRQDGSELLCDMIGTRLNDESTVWTWIDVSLRARQQRLIERQAAYTALLAEVSHIITEETREDVVLHRICQLAVDFADVALAWIGRPNESSQFEFLAAAGPAIEYLNDIHISTDPTLAEGQGAGGRAWRSGEPHFDLEFEQGPSAAPWFERARRHEFRNGAVLPIFRQRKQWALLVLYARDPEDFDEPLRNTLKQLANHVSAVLDFQDLARREREASILNGLLLDGMNVGVVVVRYPDRVVEHANAQWLAMADAKTVEDLNQHDVRDFYGDNDTQNEIDAMAEQVLARGQESKRGVLYRDLNGGLARHDIFGHRLDRGDGIGRVIWTHVDVTERHRTEEALRSASAMRETLLSNTVVGIDLVRYPDRTIIDANGGLLDLLGYTGKPEQVIGRSTDIVYAQESDNERMYRLAEEVLKTGAAGLSDVQVIRQDGSLIYLDIHGRRLEDPDSDHQIIAWTSVDVTERHRLAVELNRQAMFDALTNLPNRRALEQHLSLAIARAKRHGTCIAVGMLDLDDFKPVNDQFGHANGDTLLKGFAERVRNRLRESDFLARLGGDEFVIVLEDIDPDSTMGALRSFCRQLHTAVESSFKLDQAHKAQIDMSMGVALYPSDGVDPDSLLREADAAMYQIKARKLDRKAWWQLSAADTAAVEQDDVVNAFGKEARRLFEYIRPQVVEAETGFADAFYSDLQNRPEAAHVLANLSDKEFADLKRHQAEHLRFLLDPDTTQRAIEDRAREVGEVHALSAVTPDWIGGAVTLYGQLLRDTLSKLATTTRRQYRALRIADTRLWLDMQTQLRALQRVMDAYHAHIATPLPQPGSWASLAQQELDALACLPGIRACQVMRPDSDGQFAIEASSGEVSEQLVSAVHEQTLLPRLDAQTQTGQGVVNASWRSGQPERVDSYDQDARTRPWHALFRTLGVRSLVAVPIHVNDGPSFLVVVEGRYVNQFAPGWMQSFSASLAQRWRQVANRATQRAASLRQSEAQSYRQLLRSDGLRMHVQPVIETDSGRMVRVEALARLVTPSGEIIAPGQFLPALHDEDFRHLFRQGLDQSLRYVRSWIESGFNVGIALNIAPTTLIHPDCASWVSHALTVHSIPPHLLTLEVLETQEFDEQRHDSAIDQLRSVGVQLAIDDLGRGYSSLTRLARLPADIIKVDQTLVRALTTDPLKTLTLLRAIILIGSDLDREVVIEGVETAPMLEAARLLGAHLAQGYGIARPMPADRLLLWHEEWQRTWTRQTGPQSYLGAFAYFLRRMHEPELAHAADKDSCPLYEFLAARIAANSEPFRWHAILHTVTSQTERADAQQHLTAWLAHKVKEEGQQPLG